MKNKKTYLQQKINHLLKYFPSDDMQQSHHSKQAEKLFSGSCFKEPWLVEITSESVLNFPPQNFFSVRNSQRNHMVQELDCKGNLA